MRGFCASTLSCRSGGEVQRVQEGQLLPDPVAPPTGLPAVVGAEEEGRQEPAEGERARLNQFSCEEEIDRPPVGCMRKLLNCVPRLVMPTGVAL